MTRRYTYKGAASIEVACAVETEVGLEVTYSVTPGAQAIYGQPAEGQTVEIHDVRLMWQGAQLEVPSWLSDIITGPEEMTEELIAYARDVEAYTADDAADARREHAM